MAVNPVNWAMSNPALVITAVLALIAIVWAYEAYEEADDKGEALQGFGARTKSGTGGALNVVLVSLVTLTGWAATTFGTAAEAGQFLIGLAPNFPVLTASLFSISLGTIGLSDVIVLRPFHFLGLALAAILVAIAFKTDFGQVGLQ
ncbi:hypothetical protein [Halorussus amylolyticus]|uniref:hypothetical protein n=1 Tax=Halorussus amylolyticus TaxID=1126242 RepID=UPI001EE3B2AA|nr:hypothetical protein [Halorussus amylolyticus]